NELAGLLTEILQDRTRFEDRDRLAARSLMIDNRGDLLVRIDLGELRRELVALPDVDRDHLVRQLAFLEHQKDLDDIRTGEDVEVDHVRVLPQTNWALARISFAPRKEKEPGVQVNQLGRRPVATSARQSQQPTDWSRFPALLQ